MPRGDGGPGGRPRRDSLARLRSDSMSGLEREMRGPALGIHMPTPIDSLLHVSFLEALPQLMKLLQLLWLLVPVRTVIMLLGNFTKSLLPAVDLKIRAELIDIINNTIRHDRDFQGQEIGRLLVLQLLSLVLRNLLSVALANNQQYVNAKLTAVLKRKLMETHLKLDTAALEVPENQRLLTDAVYMSNPGYLGNLVTITFNLTNSIIDITARIAATSQTISWDALPYFMLYSFVPLLRISYTRFNPSNWTEQPNQADMLRRDDLASIAFDTKVWLMKRPARHNLTLI